MDRRALVVSSETAGERLDRWLAAQLPGVSRARLKTLIDAGLVRVDGAQRKAAHHVATGERVEVEIPPLPPETLEPEPIALTIVHEDEHVLVLDKPAGMVVHPGAGHARGTLAAAVLAHAPGTAGVGGPRRPGVVHRLDKDTSGLLVVAKTAAAYESLTAQLLARTVRRVYHAVVHGRVAGAEGIVDQAIGRHPHDRTRMAVRPVGRGRRAVTRWRVLERFADFTLSGGAPGDRTDAPDPGPPVPPRPPGGRRQRVRRAPSCAAPGPDGRARAARRGSGVPASGVRAARGAHLCAAGSDRAPPVSSTPRALPISGDEVQQPGP